MPDLKHLLDQIDRLDEELSKPVGHDQISLVESAETEWEFHALARTALPQLAKALQAVIESCEETIRSVDKNLLPDERDHANRDHADMVLDAITDAMEGDDD